VKFCYLDESGTGQQTVVILVGVVVDVQRMDLTKREWNDLFDSISKLSRRPIREIHATKLIPGRGAWSGVDGETRAAIVDKILNWFVGRKHKIVFAAVDKKRFCEISDEDKIKRDLKDEWNAAAFHIVLSIQKCYSRAKGNKGDTLFIFDMGKPPSTLINMILRPPQWSDNYYTENDAADRLDKIVDVPFYADSQNIQMIKIADLVCYILRRYAELKDYGQEEAYSGELKRYEDWVSIIKPTCIAKSHRYRIQKTTDSSRFFTNLAPKSLTEL